MGFGIRIPGIRISAKGVRLGRGNEKDRVVQRGQSVPARQPIAPVQRATVGSSLLLSPGPSWVSVGWHRSSSSSALGFEAESRRPVGPAPLAVRGTAHHTMPDHTLQLALTAGSVSQEVLAVHAAVRDVLPALKLVSGFSLPPMPAMPEEGDASSNPEAAIVLAAQRRFKSGEPLATLVGLQLLFVDNAGAAAPVGLDGGDLTVLMAFPAAHDIVPMLKRDSERGVERRTTAEIVERHVAMIKVLALQTALEAIEVQPHVRRVRILVMDPTSGDPNVGNRRVLVELNATSTEIRRPAEWMIDVQQGVLQFAKQWWQAHTDRDEASVRSLLNNFWGGVEAKVAQLEHIADALLESVEILDHSNEPPFERPTINSRASVDESDGVGDEVFDAIAAEEIAVGSLFWVHLAVLLDEWANHEGSPPRVTERVAKIAVALGIDTSRDLDNH